MKIVIPLLSLEHHGGIRDIIEIANYLAEKRHRVIIYVPEDRFKTHYNISKKVIIRKIKKSGRGFTKLLGVLMWYMFYLEKADLYIANFFPTFYPVFIKSFFAHTPFVYFVQDIETKFVKFPLNIFAFLTYLIPSKKITLSGFIKNALKDKDAHVASAGVSSEFLELPLSKRSYKMPLVVGHIYRKEHLKNSKLFMQALPSILEAGFHVIIVGDGKKISQRHKNLTIIPYGNSTYLRDNFYDKIDIFVHTSYIEGFGLPPLEAMARGCVVMLTQSGGPKEYAKKNNVIFIDKYNPMDITEKLLRFSKQPDILKEISKNAIKEAKKHPLSHIGIAFEQALKNQGLLYWRTKNY